MDFQKYQHLERLGSDEVDGITVGEVYVFPKLDGTNASVWMDSEGNVKCGSRNRELTLEKDNAGFCKHVHDNYDMYKEFFDGWPNLRLFGEWLVPHSLKTYRDDAWEKFYIFDVVEDKDDGTFEYYNYDRYRDILDSYCMFNYLSPFAKVKNGTDERFRSLTDKNIFYIKENKGVGEGIVLKNYDFVNKYGRVTWAKVITNAFKEAHVLEMGGSEYGGLSDEEKIVNEFITQHLVDKTYEKIKLDDGWSAKSIPRLLNTVFHDFVVEEMWDVLKKYKNPKLDFKFINRLSVAKIKELRPDLF